MTGLNLSQVVAGTLAPGVFVNVSRWGIKPQKMRFFTIVVDPSQYPLAGLPYDVEITRVWSTSWISNTQEITYQFNVQVTNVGKATTLYILNMAETDN